MSTAVRELDSRLISTNTVSRSIRSEWRDRRTEPEDLRTRRFGYNPGYLMQMDPTITGLQTTLVQPGVLILFETSPVRKQNWSVDPEDNSPPDREAELLAGEGLGALYQQNAHMGFREVLPLRGLTDEQALALFYYAHPPLSECVASGLIEPCPHGLHVDPMPGATHNGSNPLGVCITCRLNVLNAIRPSLPEAARATHALLVESAQVGASNMRSMWNAWVGELAESQGVNRPRMALGQLQEGHYYFMRQLHERTPTDRELYRIQMQAQAQAEANATALEASLKQQREFVADLFKQYGANDPRLTAMAEQMANMQAELETLRAKANGNPENN